MPIVTATISLCCRMVRAAPLCRQAGRRASRQGRRRTDLPDGVRGHACRLRSWDQLIVPLPFARVLIEVGEPLAIPPHASAEQLEDCRSELERRLAALTEAVDARVAA